MKIKKLAQKIKSKFTHQIHDDFEDVNLGMGSTYQEDIRRLHNKKIKNTKSKK
jgi:ribosomal protein S17E